MVDAAEMAWDDCLPDLPLDAAHLPPLNALSASSSDELPNLDLLDLLPLDAAADSPILSSPPTAPLTPQKAVRALSTEKLSDCTSTPSDTSATTRDPPPREATSAPPKPDLVAELSTRLHAAGAEATALRKRVAALAQENRALRAALDHANARLVAVAQAAAVQPPPQSQMMLGLAQVSADVAHRITNALSISDTTEEQGNRKKRKLVTGAATTMACVMFMWGAMVGTPGMLKGSTTSYRSEGNLPAIWNSNDAKATALAPTMPRVVDPAHSPWQPNCMRVMKQLPNGSEKEEDDQDAMDEDSADAKTEQRKEEEEDVKTADRVVGKKDEEEAKDGSRGKTIKEENVVEHDAPEHGDRMYVNLEDKEAATVVARSDQRAAQVPDYSYVLCRDAEAAIGNVKACASRMARGEKCGQPHTISLILPASAAGLAGEPGAGEGGLPALAEVQCSITSVARIPSVPSVGGAGKAAKPKSHGGFGRVVATVAEGGSGRHAQ